MELFLISFFFLPEKKDKSYPSRLGFTRGRNVMMGEMFNRIGVDKVANSEEKLVM